MNYTNENHKATNVIARHKVNLTVMVLIGFIQRLIGITLSKLELVSACKPKRAEAAGLRSVAGS